MLKNTSTAYGWVAIALHWVIALTVFGLYGLGLWMDDLTYYSPWYQLAPHWHKSMGVLLVVAMLSRLIWRQINAKPESLSAKPWERRIASWTHRAAQEKENRVSLLRRNIGFKHIKTGLEGRHSATTGSDF